MKWFDKINANDMQENNIFHVSHSLSAAVRRFSYFVAHGTVGQPLLGGIDYLAIIKDESSFIEQAFAVFINNIKMDKSGSVLNYDYCERRAAQYIREYFDENYIAEPAFEDWEVVLYDL